jgi:DNA-binding LacI/PurR family transcriptional regulator
MRPPRTRRGNNPDSVTDWKGDGIIARIQSRSMAEKLALSGIPVVDVLGVVPDLPFPLVHVDSGAIARMAAEHLLERGFRQFGFFGIEGENWSEQRYAGLCATVAPVQREVPFTDCHAMRAAAAPGSVWKISWPAG